jgi:putative transposase
VWVALVHSAGVQDRVGARLLLAKAKLERAWPRMALLWVDGGYESGYLARLAWALFRWAWAVVRKAAGPFRALPRRWVVERTFGWLSNYRRLGRHYEYHDETGEALIYVAMTHLMLRRLRPAPRRRRRCARC